MGSQLRIGEVYRSARNRDPSVELIDNYPNIHHATASEILAPVQLSKGINPIAKVKSSEGQRRPAILIRSSPWKAGTTETPWHDVFDLDRGRISYFGDHRVDHTEPLGHTPGNRVLLNVLPEHQSRTADQRASAVPLLVFASVTRNKTPKGYVQFCGVAVIDGIERVEQEVEGEPFPNYRYELSVLDLSAESERLDWAWIEARANPELSAAHTVELGPRSWRQWVERGPAALSQVRRQAIRPAPEVGLRQHSPDGDRGATALLPTPRRQEDLASDSSGTPASSDDLTVSVLMDRLRSLRTQKRNGRPSRQNPLALLWGISRVATGKPSLAPWRQFRDEVGGLLAEFEQPDSAVTPEYPFWHLQTSHLWDVHGVPPEHAAVVHAATFDRLNPEGGVTTQAERLLSDACVRTQAVALLRETYLADVDQHALMDRLGLAGYESASGLGDLAEEQDQRTGPAARRAAVSYRIVRDTVLTARVKKLHGDRCQVCGLQLRTQYGTYSEAAHIRGLGRPHHGPDELSNVLVLCPNHHVQFDTLALYIDADGVVRATADDSLIDRLRRHPAHRIGEEHVRYHRALCGRDTTDRDQGGVR
ncbi:HNH endonuclease [Streptomyces sp. NPDC017941]|uniref:HNH endonuclease n=1 Tax=Streptomyces sp. NPDC017941 TaxID=3365018 RepID=UPI0037AC38B8